MRNTIILLYHDIDSKEKPTEKEDLATKETVVKIEEFESHMAYLADEGYRVLAVKEYLNGLDSGNLSNKDIVLTFDDGHISNYQFALPILRKHSFFATFFVIAGNIGKPYYMGSREIIELLDYNIEIGSHSLTHSYLTELSYSEIKRELTESKDVIEDCIGRPVKLFAYPGGHLNSEIVKIVQAAGYMAAVSCEVGRNNLRTDPFLLKRIEIRRGTSLRAFQRALRTTNIIFYQGVDIGKNLLKRAIGLKKYEYARNKLYYFYPFKR